MVIRTTLLQSEEDSPAALLRPDHPVFLLGEDLRLQFTINDWRSDRFLSDHVNVVRDVGLEFRL